MCKRIFIPLFILLFYTFVTHASDFSNKSYWITTSDKDANKPNSWIAFRKDITLDQIPNEAIANICADSKYWLWINGEFVVFEGGLKRGPNPKDSYYDRVNLTQYLKKGKNQVAVLLWYFGKSGFSHIDSGKSGLLFSSDALSLYSDATWMTTKLLAYGTCGAPQPNFRLSESSIRYDANQEITEWQTDAQVEGFKNAVVIGKPGDTPWNNLLLRPIPLWKDYGLKPIRFDRHRGPESDTLVAHLPYNMQFTPEITFEDPQGNNLIKIQTDHLYGGSECGVRAEYISKKGKQCYESLGWMNGEELYVIVPNGLKINKIRYRQTGYDGINEGFFECDDEFTNRFWQKALHTLYVNMRDTFFDCPDRERAQWWGDVTVLMGECFYTYSTKVHQLMKKAILELCAFQRPTDNCLHSPIPGNYDAELPAQMLASIGLYGFWNYYMNTGDMETIRTSYPHVRDYLNVWKTDETGLTAERHGGWDWGDWGENRDIRLIYAGWHYMALDAAAKMADLLNLPVEASHYRFLMQEVKKGYNACWNGLAYRHPSHKGDTDDRVQALAVISGIADKSKYEQIISFLENNKHASPYMEKYILESLFIMKKEDVTMLRFKERFKAMVNDSIDSTLYEGWGIGSDGYGGGTSNHAWSGGPLTVISQYLMGITPLEAGWNTFEIKPQITSFNQATIHVPTVKGMVKFKFKKKNRVTTYWITVPENTICRFYSNVDGKPIELGSGDHKLKITNPNIN